MMIRSFSDEQLAVEHEAEIAGRIVAAAVDDAGIELGEATIAGEHVRPGDMDVANLAIVQHLTCRIAHLDRYRRQSGTARHQLDQALATRRTAHRAAVAFER